MGKFARLKRILREMFQLDRGDLDFGLYRIMSLKAAEITAFLDDDLLPQVKEALQLTSDIRRSELEKELKVARRRARGAGYDPDENPSTDIIDLNRLLAEMKKDADAETDVYNHLANFFARYYSEGDFISQRRYSSGGHSAYLIPYDGEEVKLHWANSDQYYVKTTENYSSYTFVVGTGTTERRIRFEIAAADNEKDNVKEVPDRQLRFVLSEEHSAIEVEGGELVVRFEHRPLRESEKKKWPGNIGTQQNRINTASVKQILEVVDPEWSRLLAAPAPTDSDDARNIVAKHVERYTAKNTFDYFIHKDLGKFLLRELDLYLNTTVLNLDDLHRGDVGHQDRAFARARAIRHVGGKIIDFLAQLENFQKRLWLKKKFVLETHWCVTLDRVPEELYPAIASNNLQCAEWVKLLAVDQIQANLTNGTSTWKNPPSVDFFKAHPYLVLDTQYFDRDFTDRLLTALCRKAPLDEQLDGLLVHGENFQALRLIQPRYREEIKCIYIDPPYNTDASAILYKNNYKDSSWLSLMENSLSLARDCLTNDGILCVAIDDEEVSLLRLVLGNMFERALGIVAVRSNPAGRKSKGQFSPTHEYALFFGNAAAVPGTLDKTESQLARYPHTDEKGRYAWNNLIRHGSGDRRQDRPTMYYPIYVGENDTLRIPAMKWDVDKQEYTILEKAAKGEIAVWPVAIEGENLVEKRWHRGTTRITSDPSEYRIRRSENVKGANAINIDFKIRIDMNSMPKTWWDNKKYASANLGAKILKDLFGEHDFDFAKAPELVKDCLRASNCNSPSVVLDFFAGSGTTAHAVLNLNRKDGGRRKYILVEIGRHFETVILPRMKKVIHSPDWKEGKPVSRKGVTHLFKYVRLESYEDTLDSLEVTPPSKGHTAFLAANPALAEDYRLRYMLGLEASGSVCLLGKEFSDPFAYTISIVRNGLRREVPVDLPETFNFLIGLRVESRRRIDGVLATTGTDTKGHRCLILWRNTDDTDCYALDDWFERHRDQFDGPVNIIYVNGDQTLNALQLPGESWIAKSIEPIFRELMFGETGRDG